MRSSVGYLGIRPRSMFVAEQAHFKTTWRVLTDPYLSSRMLEEAIWTCSIEEEKPIWGALRISKYHYTSSFHSHKIILSDVSRYRWSLGYSCQEQSFGLPTSLQYCGNLIWVTRISLYLPFQRYDIPYAFGRSKLLQYCKDIFFITQRKPVQMPTCVCLKGADRTFSSQMEDMDTWLHRIIKSNFLFELSRHWTKQLPW